MLDHLGHEDRPDILKVQARLPKRRESLGVLGWLGAFSLVILALTSLAGLAIYITDPPVDPYESFEQNVPWESPE